MKTRQEKLAQKRLAYKKDPDKMRKRRRDWIKNNTERAKELRNKSYKKTYTKGRYYLSVRTSFLKKKYGLSLERYNLLREQQDFRCALCSKKEADMDRHLAVDHDHDTGKVRGLLCMDCNTGLGKFGDKIVRLKNALIYLQSTTI